MLENSGHNMYSLIRLKIWKIEIRKEIRSKDSHYWIELLVKEYHEKLFHAGASHTLSQIRNLYWIPKGRTAVKSVLYGCGIYRKHNGELFKMPRMSAGPTENMNKSEPFLYMILDYLGPFYVKGESINEKVWICLFICVTVRAIHLEVIDDMTVEQFLMAFRRFSSRRGIPEKIILDNALQFKLAETCVDKA